MCESSFDENDVASLSAANNKLCAFLSSDANEIKSVSLVFRPEFRCGAVGGGANEPLLKDVGNDLTFPKLFEVVLQKDSGRGRVVDLLLTLTAASKLL